MSGAKLIGRRISVYASLNGDLAQEFEVKNIITDTLESPRWVALGFALSLLAPGLGCERSGSDKAEPTAKAAEPETERDSESDSDPGPARHDAEDADAEPTIASSVPSGTSKTTVEKTEAVEREAADLTASQVAARTIANDPRLQALVDDAAGKALHVPKGALDHFYTQLAPLAESEGLAQGADADAGPQVVRVLHVGDSFIGQDVFPHAIRRRMQARFGDAGPGFQLAALRHRSNISRVLGLRSRHFRSEYVRDAGPDRVDRFGYAGHIASGGVGARSWLTPRDPGPFASGQGYAEVWYQTHPRGATLELTVGETVKTIDTRSDEVADRWIRVPLTTPEAELRIAALEKGRLRVYGAAFQTGMPGVVWDSAVHSAAFTNRVLSQEPEHFAGQIAHRKVDLLVFNFGGNDLRRVAKGNLTQEALVGEIGAVLDLYKAGRPEMSCLVVSSTDHARSGKTRVLPEHVETVVGAERAAAEAKGCAFFDSLSVLGGVGMARTWARRKHPLVGHDLSHLTALGRELLAEVLVAELLRYHPVAG